MKIIALLALLALSRAPMTVHFQVLEEGIHSGIAQRVALLATTGDTWHELFRRIHKNRMPLPVPPEVHKEEPGVYLYVGAGVRNTAGYRLQVDRVEMKKGVFTVYATETCPPPGSAALTVLTQPYVVIFLPWDAPDVVPQVEVLLCSCGEETPDTLRAIPWEQWKAAE